MGGVINLKDANNKSSYLYNSIFYGSYAV